MNPKGLSPLYLSSSRITDVLYQASFNLALGGSNSGPYAFKTCTVSTEQCSQPRLVSQQANLKCKEAELPKPLTTHKVNTELCSLTPQCGRQLGILAV